jgi:hypothetical protein
MTASISCILLAVILSNMLCSTWQDTYRVISYHPVALFEYLAHVVRARIIVVACACCSGESRACFRKRSIRLSVGSKFRRRLIIHDQWEARAHLRCPERQTCLYHLSYRSGGFVVGDIMCSTCLATSRQASLTRSGKSLGK